MYWLGDKCKDFVNVSQCKQINIFLLNSILCEIGAFLFPG